MFHAPDRLTNLKIAALVALGFVLLFSALLAVARPDFLSEPGLRINFLLLIMAFITSMVVAAMTAEGLLAQFVQRLYALSPEDAQALVTHILFGVPDPPFAPTLRVDKGHVDPEGSEVMRKVGGPGYLSIGHDTAAVVARGGIIIDVLGPGFHRIDPFVKVWEAVDLRPQLRKVRVETNTRDGIPIYCDAEVRFHIDNGEDKPRGDGPNPYPFTEEVKETVLNLATTKVTLAPGGKKRFTRWTKRVASGIVDGEVRNRLEQYKLDDLLASEHTTMPPVEALEQEIEDAAKESAKALGIYIERVQMGPILPSEDAISQQWIETWGSEWERVAADIKSEAEASETENLELARIHAQADLINAIVQEMQSLNINDVEIPQSFITLRLIESLRTLAENDPMVRSTLLQQAESLKRIVESVHEPLPGPKSGPPAKHAP